VTYVTILRETFVEFGRHKGQWLAASIAFFATFAIAPFIIVVVEVAGFVTGHHTPVLTAIDGYVRNNAGADAADGIHALVQAGFEQHRDSLLTQVVGWGGFVVAAIGFFSAVQDALNTMFDVEPKKQGLYFAIVSRLVSAGVILLVVCLLLGAVAANAGLGAVAALIPQPGSWLPFVVKGASYVVSFVFVTVLLAVSFKYGPERHIQWKSVWPGAITTSVLFAVGQLALGWYLGRGTLTSTYGAFGSLIAILLWVFYSAQIVLFGAQLTSVHAHETAKAAAANAGAPDPVRVIGGTAY
jgi:membrane protein